MLPGQRSTLPHAEEKEEEFAYVLEGELLAWIDGEVFPLKKGDLVAFSAGTGITHAIINDSEAEALLLVGGEATKSENRLTYPLNPERREQLKPGKWWEDAPPRKLGPHDGKPKGTQGNADMNKSPIQKGQPPSKLIDARIKELPDWQGKLLSQMRALIKQADPKVVEEWKWGVPVWSHDGLISAPARPTRRR